jgi:hypothetical protein
MHYRCKLSAIGLAEKSRAHAGYINHRFYRLHSEGRSS